MARGGEAGPVWAEPSLLVHLGVLALVGLQARPRVLIELWLGTLLAGSILVQRMPGLNASPDLAEITLLSAVVLLAAGALRGRGEAQRRLAEQQRISDTERARRALLEERTRIARELHDVVAHHMSVIAIQAEAAPYRPPDQLTRSLAAIRANAVEGLRELRRALGVLRDDGANGDPGPQSTLEGLDDLLTNVQTAGLTVALLHLLRASHGTQTVAMTTRRAGPAPLAPSAFAGFCFPPDVIVLAVRWYLRFALSYRDVEELLTERGIQVDHVTIYRWVQRFTPLLAEAARPCRHAVGNRWQVDETYTRVAGQWRYVYRAIDQFGQVIDVFVSPRRDATAARRFFQQAIGMTKATPMEVVTDKAATYPIVLDELLPAAWHRIEQYANNHIEADHGRLKSRLRPMRGLKQDRSARVVIAGHALVQNLRRGHYELAVEAPASQRVAMAFDDLALKI